MLSYQGDTATMEDSNVFKRVFCPKESSKVAEEFNVAPKASLEIFRQRSWSKRPAALELTIESSRVYRRVFRSPSRRTKASTISQNHQPERVDKIAAAPDSRLQPNRKRSASPLCCPADIRNSKVFKQVFQNSN